MVELQVLSGKKAGLLCLARLFPVTIGRGQNATVHSDEPGVWEQHARIDLVPNEGFVLTVQPGALATVNDQPAICTRLRNGDTIQCGALRFRFWLSPAKPTGLRASELLVWVLLAVVVIGQIALLRLL